MGMFLKDPAARLDYAVDWSADFLNGATIVASDWDVEPPGIAIGGATATATRTGATFDGGTAGTVYRVVNRITLSDGRRDDRALVVRVEAR
ncbi:MAG: hypothetical protein JO290_05060 [Sphingomonadaceae bacterium]|nr:hypothetical protein [Sphingomonadaceae bacterium]